MGEENDETVMLTSYYVDDKEVLFCPTCTTEIPVETVGKHTCFNEQIGETGANENSQAGIETESSSTSTTFEEMLISHVQAQRALWDSRLPLSERSKTIKDQAWLHIYKSLGGACSLEILQKKWRNLRDKFIKVKSETEVWHSGMERKSKKTVWKHYENLQFLKDTVSGRPTKTHLTSSAAVSTPSPTCSSASDGEFTPKRRKGNDSKALNDAILETLKLQPPTPPQPLVPEVDHGNPICTRLAEILNKLPFRKRAELEIEFLQKAYAAATENEAV